MPKVKNITDEAQAVTGIPAFQAGETREVSEEEADRLSRCPNFEMVTASRSESRRRKIQEEEEVEEEESSSEDDE
jgi:hypothetical protein